MVLSILDQELLLSVARQALESRVCRLPPPDPACSGPLALRCGVFVSIHHGQHLRGCLGSLSGGAPLARTLPHLGAAVADSDPRFPAVAATELPQLHIELSLLTPERRIGTLEDIEVGRHGLIVEQGRTRGLLLPQVATEYAWDREKFVEHTCIKAGLAPDAWKNGARLHTFEALVFSERPDPM